MCVLVLFIRQVDYKFMVHHYAGEIVYATEGFLEKNRDLLHQEGIDLLRSSSSEFIRSFGDRCRSTHLTCGNPRDIYKDLCICTVR